MRTFQPKAAEIERKWYVIDAQGLILGQLATRAAHLLRGKHKPTWVPHLDMGDNVIIINAEKLDIPIKKGEEKTYHFHSGYPGGLRSATLDEMMAKKPEKVVELAITGMLPHTRLGRAMAKKLHVYASDSHPHGAQQPESYVIESKKLTANI